MKKTLFLLSSLALVAASAQAATLCSTTFNRKGNSLDSVEVTSQSDYDLTTSASISSSNFRKGEKPANKQSGDLLGQPGIPSSVVTPNSNVASGGSWSMSFTFTNNSGRDMLISSIDLSMIGVNGSGDPQNGLPGVVNKDYVGGYDGNCNKPVNMTLSIDGQAAQTLAYNGATSQLGGSSGSWDEIRTGSYNYDNLFLGAGDFLTITIKASQNADYNQGCFAGLTGIQINGELVVPEPATASLGLLGLAALMMRRRRA